ncbi:phosphatidylinositol-specific phospholipase C [Chromobacterium haemolyticum]|uniref:phosphatidylinositol-specific phospholipase C n=1 Tax=Chromobacterium haemolyticum TaxID=394935 RepID=UPI000DEEBC41|nr:phosphatidylinositol-specific phospholipase C [Chromobacterium haemolyticum]
MKTLFATLSLSLAASSPAVLAHAHSAYSHDSNFSYRHPKWMGLLDDGLTVSQLSLPGTHDTMSRYGGDSVATQTLPLRTQLDAGVRAFDIRLRSIANSFAIHHGPVFQQAMFGDVLNDMSAFLRANPSETLFVRVKEEHTPENSSMSFQQIFESYYNRYSGYIAIPASNNPSLREVRGKIVFLQNFSSSKRYGISYGAYNIQDQYSVSTNWDLYGKWEKIKAHLNQANTSPRGNGYINYLTASGGSFPYFIASGHSNPATGAPRLATGLTTPGWKNSYPDFPRVNCFIGICTIAFEGSNVLTQEYIQRQRPAYAGMVMADFPGPGLIDTLIQLNLKTCKRWSAGDRATLGDIYRYDNPYSKTVDYFRSRKSGGYWYFPTNQSSNGDWEYLGHASACRD